MRERPFNASGVQIALLVFAVVFLAWPLQKYLGPLLPSAEELPRTISRLFIFVPGIIILLAVPAVRRYCAAELMTSIPRGSRPEVAGVAAFHVLLFPLAASGAIVLWHWSNGGEMALARRLGEQETARAAFASATSTDGVVLLLLTALAVPIVEELVFRAMLFRTWEAQWGRMKAIIATSIVFAAYHPIPFIAFCSSLILTALYARTRSIRACILVHALFNGLMWYPLIGQYAFRTVGKETGEIELWTLHVVALAALAIALPLYLWAARDTASSASTIPVDCAPARS